MMYVCMYIAIWFRYDLSAITVRYVDRRKPFYHFITMVKDKKLLPISDLVCVILQICAIIGGTFTVAGLIDSIIFNASEIFHKLELGKLS